jgi:hypothetical protein
MTPSAHARRHTTLFVAALIVTFVGLRAWLRITPNADFNVAGYNIHHLFTGVLVVTVTSVPLAVGVGVGRARDVLVAGLGVGLGLVLDEWVYLIATPGTNADYLLPVSFRGGVVMVALGALYAVGYSWTATRRKPVAAPREAEVQPFEG